MAKYIFCVEYGGLGDHLFYTPLPRLLKEQGLATEVYLSSSSQFRHPETYDFVWKNNPYLNGISHESPSKLQPVMASLNKISNVIVSLHGVNSNNELRPEIYSETLIRDSYREENYIDFNYTSFVGAFTILDAVRILNSDPKLILVNPTDLLLRLTNRAYVRTTSLKDYAALIRSANTFSCLASGGATLSAALDRTSAVYYGHGFNEFFLHSSNNNFFIGDHGKYRTLMAKILALRNQLKIKYLNKH